MKVHIGADAQTGVVHSVTDTGELHDVTEAHRLLPVERNGCGAIVSGS